MTGVSLRDMPTREEAWELVCEWVTADSLRKHLLGVEAAMVAYAEKWDDDAEKWAVTGLVHDLDYERFPDMDDTERGHPRTIIARTPIDQPDKPRYTTSLCDIAS